MEILKHPRTTGRHRRTGTLAFAVALGFVAAIPCSPAERPGEYEVKAAFIYNFAKFIQWPVESFATANSPITFCVLGQDPFAGRLETTLAHQSVNGRPLAVRYLSSAKQAAGCQVLFLSSAENAQHPPNLAEIMSPGILTIGDSEATAKAGVVINFRVENGKVRFDINLVSGERQKLQISSNLLNLAHVGGPVHK